MENRNEIDILQTVTKFQLSTVVVTEINQFLPGITGIGHKQLVAGHQGQDSSAAAVISRLLGKVGLNHTLFIILVQEEGLLHDEYLERVKITQVMIIACLVISFNVHIEH